MEHLDLGGPFFAYVDVDGDVDKLAGVFDKMLAIGGEVVDGMPPHIANLDFKEVAAELGLSQIDAIGMSSRKYGEFYRNTMYVHVPDGRIGLLKVLGGEAAPFVARKLAPEDSDLVWEQDLDLKSGYALVEMLVRRFGGPDAAVAFAGVVSEPTPVGLSIADIFAKLDTKLTVVGRIHPDKPLEIPGAPLKIPGVDLLLVLDGVGDLYTRVTGALKAEMPAEAQKEMFEEGDGYEQISIPVPPDVAAFFSPVIRHELKSGRVCLASSAAYLDECLGKAVY
jgi:hypothetical protein